MSGKRRVVRGENEAPSSNSTDHSPSVTYIVAAMEAVLLALVFLTPWAYGAAHPSFEFLLNAGIALLLALWAARMVMEGRITWKKSSVAVCLAGLFLLGVWQNTPLPRSVLSWLSPATAHCYDQFLPTQPQTPPDNVIESNQASPAGSTLSLYPGSTKRETARLLAVFLLFIVVYNNLTSKETLIRLSWVALINGVLLSLFALAQFFSAPPQTVYWTYPALVTPFGPFICRNHFPYYVNMCIGLGIGLLVGQERRGRSLETPEQNGSFLQTWQNPRALWICAALSLMISAVAFSRSRAGLLALLGAAVICGILGRLRLGRSFRLSTAILVAGVVVGLSAWFGFSFLKSRFATFASQETYETGRFPLWIRSVPMVKDFPIWGTGYGTFGYVEPMYRPDAPFEDLMALYDHAHNDYLEILAESGVIGFALVVSAVVIIFGLGYRALSVNRGSRRAGLAFGALFAFTAVALHSFADFGSHIPAITLLAIVVSAHLCALGHSKPHKKRRLNTYEGHPLADTLDSGAGEADVGSNEYCFRFGGIAPVVGAITALGFGLVLCAGSWKAHRIDRLIDAAFQMGNSSSDVRTAARLEGTAAQEDKSDRDRLRAEADRFRTKEEIRRAAEEKRRAEEEKSREDIENLRSRIDYLSDAVSLGPENTQLHYELGFAHERLAELLAGATPPDPMGAREHSLFALREYRRARDACPLMSMAHLGLATIASLVKEEEIAADELRRTKLLTPGQPLIWHLCGLLEFKLNRPEDAWASWRHSLGMLPKEHEQRFVRQQFIQDYLPQVLIRIRTLRAKQMLEKALPDSPDVLYASAIYLYPDDGAVERRRPFLEKALSFLQVNAEELGPEQAQLNLYLKVRIHRALEQPDEAIQAYRDLIAWDRSKTNLRIEFAYYLYELRRFKEARDELQIVRALNPNNSGAKALLDEVVSEQIAEKNKRPRRRFKEWEWIPDLMSKSPPKNTKTAK
jgi:O-antigen ligase/tetratricopeptide (TPR) repeat protein